MKKKVISVTTVSFERIAFEKGIAVSYWNDPTGVSHRLKCYQPYHFCRLFDVLFPDRNKQLEYIRFTPESLSEFIRFLHFTLRELSKNTKIEAQLLEVVHSGISYPELYPLSENIGLFSIRAKHSDLLEYLGNSEVWQDDNGEVAMVTYEEEAF